MIIRGWYFVVIMLLALILTSCDQTGQNTPAPVQKVTAEVEYADDSEGWESDDEPNARLSINEQNATANGKICLERLSNETEIFKQQFQAKLWNFGLDEPQPTRAFIDGAGANKYDKPTYTVNKTQARSYTRKTVKVGWYLAEFDGSGDIFKFQILAGSDGLLIYNENSFTSQFRGYFASYGKMKISWKVTPGFNDNTVLSFFKAQSAYTNIWVYAQDGPPKTGAQFWFMPVGTYTMDYNLHNDSRFPTQEVNLTVATGKVYPYVKLIN